MTDATIRPLQGEEMLDVMFNLNMYAFRASPPFANKEEWVQVARERKGMIYHAMFEAGAAVAGAASTAMTQNVRGTLFPAGGMWAVVTLPAARRQGYSKRLIASLLVAERESGRVFSNLYPFRESFYERLGYVTLPLPFIARLAPSALAPLLGKDLGGAVELQLFDEALDTYREFLGRLREGTHGMAFFDGADRAAARRNPQWMALARVNGAVDGLMLYSLQGEEVGRFNLRAVRFYYLTSRGRYVLLDWIARHIDQADRAEIWLPPYERPETWLADLQVKVESAVRAPMSRLLDITRIGGLPAGSGRFSARLTDPLCPWNEGAWRFESRDGALQVAPAERADCDLTIQSLTALIFGTHDPQDFSLRGWGNPSPDLQMVMRTMFPAMTPHLHEYF
jgi:predicted acetyltransferase